MNGGGLYAPPVNRGHTMLRLGMNDSIAMRYRYRNENSTPDSLIPFPNKLETPMGFILFRNLFFVVEFLDLDLMRDRDVMCTLFVCLDVQQRTCVL